MNSNNNVDAKIKDCLLAFYEYKLSEACDCHFVPPTSIAYADKYKYYHDMENDHIDYCRHNAIDIIVGHLFNSKLEKDLFYDNNEFANRLGINHRNEIFNFIKTCHQNNSFSPESINRFINEHENIFANSNGPDEYELMFKYDKREVIKKEQYKICITNSQIFTRESKVQTFLSFILEISQDEGKGICNPKQKLSVDDILALANNIKNPKDRYRFKTKALGYFLPKKPEERRSNLNQIWLDMEKLFADELNDETRDELTKFNIKFSMINVFATEKNLTEQFLGTSLTIENLDFIVPILQFVESEKNQLVKNDKTNCIKWILKKVYSLLSETTVINEIILLMSKCECSKMKMNWKVFVVFSVLLAKSDLFNIGQLDIEKKSELEQTFQTLSKKIPIETKFKLLNFYVTEHKKNKKTDKLDDDNEKYLCDILFTDVNEFIDQFYNYYADKKEFGSEQYQCFLRGILSHLTDHFLVKDLERLHGKQSEDKLLYCVFGLDKADDPVLNALKLKEKLTSLIIDDKSKSNSEMQLFLYKFMRYVYVIMGEYSNDSFPDKIDACPGLENKDINRDIMIDFLENTLSLLNENKNISKELKHEMIYSIATLFFSDIDNCNSFLYEEKFTNIVAGMIKNSGLDIYLDKYKKTFFSYIKEQLLKVKDNKDLKFKNDLSIYIENKNRDSEIDKLQQDGEDQNRISTINNLKRRLDNKTTEINNLQRNINFYKWLYLFIVIPVLGWIFCATLYFCFHKPALNRLEQLTQGRQSIINGLDKLLTDQTQIFSSLNQLIRTQANSEKQSEQLQNDCRILLDFIDSKEQIPPENMIIEDKPKLLPEDDIFSKQK